MSVILFTGGGSRGSLYDDTSCLVAWSRVPSGGVSVSGPMLFLGVSVQGGLFQGDTLLLPYDEEQAVRILLECFLVIFQT